MSFEHRPRRYPRRRGLHPSGGTAASHTGVPHPAATAPPGRCGRSTPAASRLRRNAGCTRATPRPGPSPPPRAGGARPAVRVGVGWIGSTIGTARLRHERGGAGPVAGPRRHDRSFDDRDTRGLSRRSPPVHLDSTAVPLALSSLVRWYRDSVTVDASPGNASPCVWHVEKGRRSAILAAASRASPRSGRGRESTPPGYRVAVITGLVPGARRRGSQTETGRRRRTHLRGGGPALPARSGGGCGIRTREGVNPTRFPSVRHRPLGESSAREPTGRAGASADRTTLARGPRAASIL